MKMLNKIFFLSLLGLSVAIWAQPNQGTQGSQGSTNQGGGGLNGEFDRIQEEIDIPPNQKEVDAKQEKRTLLVAMQTALARSYRLKDIDKITENDITIEQHEQNDLLFYVKYKDFIGQFRYKNAPSKYFSLPVDSKVLLKPGSKYEERPSVFKDDNEKQGSSANTNNNQGKTQPANN